MTEQENAGLSRRPMRADARRNYDRLLEEARSAYAEHGPDASLDDIARRAGVSSGTLYRHFPTRQHLIESVLQGQIEGLSRLGHDLAEHGDPLEGIRVWLTAATEYAATYGGLSAALMTDVLDGRSGPVAAWHAEMFQVGEALLRRAQRGGGMRDDMDVTIVLRMISAIAWATRGAPRPGDQAGELLGLMLDGLRRTWAPG
jgi:AcrR family transcriptional regulator